MKKALAATSDCNSRYCALNPFVGAQIAVAEAARNLVCSGADPAAVTDCLNFGNPMKPDRFYFFKNCIEGIISACKAFETAVISGNVSFYNENPRGAINPTPTIGMVGVLESLDQRTTQYFKNDGDVIILLGESKEELGGSEYLKVIHGQIRGDAPALSLETEKNLQTAVLEAIKTGLINSAHDCSEGGLAVALAESCVSNNCTMFGANINSSLVISHSSLRKDSLLFGESQSRVVLSCAKNNAAKVLAVCSAHKVPAAQIGEVGGSNLQIGNLINLPVPQLHTAWRDSLQKLIAS
jgi:phosphoribosylformylglycinamidine synthase